MSDMTSLPRREPPMRRPEPLDVQDLDRIEQDADRIGDAALAGPGLTAPGLRTPQSGPGFPGLGQGQAIPPRLMGQLSHGLGLDLADVRLHDDAAARETADEIGAEAAVSGTDIVLGQDMDSPGADDLIAHEVAHIAQAADRPDMPAVLRRDGEGSSGLGASPPEVDFTRGAGAGPEDHHVTFAHDRAILTSAARTALRAIARAQTGAVNVDLYGYASTEGADVYNINLSAHRAVAVRRFLQPLLPEGSVIRLHAHGETDAFGAAGNNRRVGVDISEQAESTETPAQLPGLPRPSPFPEVSLGLPPLTLGGPIFSGPAAETEPEEEEDEGEVPSPDAEEQPTPPAPTLPRRFRLRLGAPLTLTPGQAQSILTLPPAGFGQASGLDYLPMARAASARGLHLPDLVDRGELETAYALHRRLYPWIPEDPPRIRNWLGNKIVGAVVNAINAQAATERAFEAHLSFEYPGILERMERQAQIDRMMRGEDEPFVIPPITIYELEFDIGPRGLQFR